LQVVAGMRIGCCFYTFLFIVNGRKLSSICMVSCIFIGRSHKKDKVFRIFLPNNLNAFSCFYSIEKPFFTAKKGVFRIVILDRTLFCGQL